METLRCRAPANCRVCPHSDRAGACALEADVDLALEALETQRVRILVHAAAPARAHA